MDPPRRYNSRSPRSRSPPPRDRKYDNQDRKYDSRRSPPPPRGLSRRYRSDDLVESSTLFVGNLSYNIRERELKEYMDKCGRVKSVTVGINRRTSQSKGYGFVEFENRRDAEEAFEKYQGFDLDGRKLRIDWDLGLEKKQTLPNFKLRRPPPRSRYRSYSRSRSRSRSPRRSRRSPSPRARSFSRSRSYSRSPPPRVKRETRSSRSPPPRVKREARPSRSPPSRGRPSSRTPPPRRTPSRSATPPPTTSALKRSRSPGLNRSPSHSPKKQRTQT